MGTDASKQEAPEEGVFDPVRAQRWRRSSPGWRNIAYEDQGQLTPPPSAKQMARGEAVRDISAMNFRDPDLLVTGKVHSCIAEWEKILPQTEEGSRVKAWVREGVEAEEFFTPLSGQFKGVSYSSDLPVAFM